MGTRFYTSSKLQGDANVPHPTPSFWLARVQHLSWNTQPTLSQSLHWKLPFWCPGRWVSPIMFITIFYFSIHLLLLLSPPLQCKFHEDKKHTHISVIPNTQNKQQQIGSQSSEQVASDFREQRSWSLRQHRKLRRNPTWSAEFPRGSGTGRVSNFGSGSGHRKVSWKALRSSWGLPCWSSG